MKNQFFERIKKMSAGRILAILAMGLGVFVCVVEPSEAEPMGTAFTYQGRLMNANKPADGLYDFQFKLYDDANTITGNQVGGDVNKPGVNVIEGYFTVELDFGSVFTGEERWLEIGVRDSDSNDVYAVLSPRQEVTATPYAQKVYNGVPKGFMILGSTKEAPAGYSSLGISVVSGDEDTWRTKVSMPTARKNAAAAEVGGKIYVIGGDYDMSSRWLTVVEEYDPGTDKWTTKASLPAGRRFHAAAAVGGKIYVFGGQNLSLGTVSTTYEYNPVADSWTTKGNMPTARKYAGAAVVDGKIYVIGGQDSMEQAVGTNEEYEPATNAWATKADMPTARQQLGVAALNGKIYAIGGYNGRVENEEYDPVLDAWSVKANMPTGRECLGVVSVINRIYAIGGMSSFQVNTNEVYEPETDVWSSNVDMPMSRSNLATAVVDRRVYVIGGDTGGVTAIATNEEFSPRVELLVYVKD
jgi:N-acetylneuraminic acid mutarotase